MDDVKEYKIGPIEVDSLWNGFKFHLFRYFKVLAIFYIGLGLVWVAGVLGLWLRGKTISEMPRPLPILIPLSLAAIIGFLLMILYMANRDAFGWFSVDETGLSILEKREATKLLGKIKYEQMRFVVLTKPNFFYSDLNDNYFLIGIRYRKEGTSSSLDSVIALGPKSLEQTDELMSCLRKKCPDLIVFPDQKISEYKCYG